MISDLLIFVEGNVAAMQSLFNYNPDGQQTRRSILEKPDKSIILSKLYALGLSFCNVLENLNLDDDVDEDIQQDKATLNKDTKNALFMQMIRSGDKMSEPYSPILSEEGSSF